MAFNTIGLSDFHDKTPEENKDLIKNNQIPSIIDSELTNLTTSQYITFTVIVVLLCCLSIVGNIGALYAVQKRKLRLFFRSCLISLAFSDLIQTVFMSTGYLAQFAAPYVQVWCLGEFLCIFIPFVTTGAILAGSMTLVGIALDRYFAVMSSVLGSWNPSKTFCIVSITSIWAMSYGIASPMYSAYSTYRVYILGSMELEVERDYSDVFGLTIVDMCISEKKSNAYYYIVVLGIIFIPTLVAFVWLNSIIAKKLWIRRRSIKTMSAELQPHMRNDTPTTTSLSAALSLNRKPQEKQIEIVQQQYESDNSCHCQEDHKICSYSTSTVPTRSIIATTTTTITTTTTKSLERESEKNNLKNNSNVDVGTGAGAGGNSTKHISSRETRHLRMFAIVLILMAVFIFFRLPAWVFLIMRMYGTYTQPAHWILHFSFGILTLTSCVLNPLLYTFLAETIQYTLLMKGKLCGIRRFFENRLKKNNCGNMIHRCNSKDNMTRIQKHHQNVKKLNIKNNDKDAGHAKDDDDEGEDNCCCKNGFDADTSNNGAKSTSKKSNDHSNNAKVYTIIIPIFQRDVM